jgi:hypothetical protein
LEPGYFLAYSCALLDEVVDEGLHLGLSELRRVSQVHQSFARVHVLGVVAEQAAALLDEGVVLEAKLEQFCDWLFDLGVFLLADLELAHYFVEAGVPVHLDKLPHHAKRRFFVNLLQLLRLCVFVMQQVNGIF